MDRRLESERRRHRTALQAWAMVFKGLAFVWWLAGAIVITAYIVGVIKMRHPFIEGPRGMPSHLIGPSIIIAITIAAVTALAAGALSWAISLALVSLGHIEENTRLAAETEQEHSPADRAPRRD